MATVVVRASIRIDFFGDETVLQFTRWTRAGLREESK